MATTTLNLTSSEYKLLVQKGGVTGTTIVQRFGERDAFGTDATGEDITRTNELTPGVSTVKIPLIGAGGVLISIVSESNADNGATATGILTAEVHYIDVNGDEQVWTPTLNGTTPVDSTILMRHINDVHALTVGSNGVAEGNIKVYLTGTNTTVYSMIALGGNQSMLTNYMIPRAKTLYLQSWDCTEANDKRITMRIRATTNEGLLLTGVFLFKDVAYVKKSSTGELTVLAVIPAFAIVKVSGWGIQAGAETSAGWWGYLVND